MSENVSQFAALMKTDAVDHGVENGIEWATLKAPMYGAVNGYVRIPEGHPWQGLGYDAIPQSFEDGPAFVSAHGGLTFDKYDWIGFDTLHAGDIWPGHGGAFLDTASIYWTPDMVAERTRRLARQIAAAGEPNTPLRHPVLSVDLDSTLADTRHRRGIIEQFQSRGERIDWTVYAKACAQDEPTGFAALLRLIQDHLPWVVVSGRSEDAREATEAWLAEQGLRPEAVFLEDDPFRHTSLGHTEWKTARVTEIAQQYPTIKIHVDDWAQVANMLEGTAVTGVTVVPPGMIPVFPAISDNPQKTAL